MLTVAATIVPSLTKCVCVVSFCVYECIMMIYVLCMYVMYGFIYDRRGGIEKGGWKGGREEGRVREGAREGGWKEGERESERGGGERGMGWGNT